MNFIDTRDIADVARVALLEEFSSELQRAYHLTGPRAWTMLQVAEQLSSLLGLPYRLQAIDRSKNSEPRC